MNIDNWLISLPLNNSQQHDLNLCQAKLQSLIDLPLRINCLPNEVIITNFTEQTPLTINNRNPLKMYWQRNLNELRLFLKLNQNNKRKLEANIVEIHKHRRLQTTRYIKQDLIQSSILISFSQMSTTNQHFILLTITGKQCILELQIPSIENEFIYHGTYKKIGEDAQSRSVTALFNCIMYVDNEMALLLSQYDLCRIIS